MDLDIDQVGALSTVLAKAKKARFIRKFHAVVEHMWYPVFRKSSEKAWKTGDGTGRAPGQHFFLQADIANKRRRLRCRISTRQTANSPLKHFLGKKSKEADASEEDFIQGLQKKDSFQGLKRRRRRTKRNYPRNRWKTVRLKSTWILMVEQQKAR